MEKVFSLGKSWFSGPTHNEWCGPVSLLLLLHFSWCLMPACARYSFFVCLCVYRELRSWLLIFNWIYPGGLRYIALWIRGDWEEMEELLKWCLTGHLSSLKEVIFLNDFFPHFELKSHNYPLSSHQEWKFINDFNRIIQRNFIKQRFCWKSTNRTGIIKCDNWI